MRADRVPDTRSNAEKALHKLLMIRPLSVPVKVKTMDGGYFADFLFPDWKMIVEIDGPWHDPERDRKRDHHLAELGLVTLRLPAEMPVYEMRQHIDNVAAITALMDIKGRIKAIADYCKKFRTVSEPIKAICAECGGSGWKETLYFNELTRRAAECVTRCECKVFLTPEDQLEGVFDRVEWETMCAKIENILHPPKPPRQEILPHRGVPLEIEIGA